MKKEAASPTNFEHIKAIIQLPFMVTMVIPFLIYFFSKSESGIPIHKVPLLLNIVAGSVVLILGLILFFKSVILLAKIGQGTLAPWNPTKKIVVKGIYRHVRNPMIIGVNLILLGQAFLIQSGNILLWALIFILMNHLYFIFKEEPALRKRYGREYKEYCKNVPRWLPRINGWRPER
ncbi:MAG: isoprenylcysteine carboxylmethyltransferase family protein [Cyclobacteriaceae bacterium]|nr:isoprenylcysteine carboxylmethyltransferase family protein [Cyclobacteriaceae bacterium]